MSRVRGAARWPGLGAILAGWLGLWSGALSAQATGAAHPGAAPPRWAHVSYISGPSVYIDAGARDGLRQGSRLDVVRDTVVIAELAVEYISSSSAACTIVRSSGPPIAVGDSVRFTPVPVPVPVPVPAPPAAAAPASPLAAASARPWSAGNALRGRIGVRYLVVDAGTGPAGMMTQPAFDVRLDGMHLSGSSLGLAVDVRAQRSILPPPDSTHPAPTYPLNVTHVYKAALIWNSAGSPATATVGRQFSSSSSSVGLFDGVGLDYARRRWSVGAFGGFEPSVATFGFSDSTREYGAYVQWHNASLALPVWSLTLGGVGAYTMGQIDREFSYLSAMYAGPRLTLYATQELDINRGWRAVQEHSTTTPTATFATAQYAVTDAVSLYGGVDNRRNVRLYTDYLNPEAAFDASFRQGVWAGASLNMRGRFRVSADERTSSGGSAGTAQSYTGAASVMRLTPLQLGVHLRATRYTGQMSSGTLQSASAEANPFDLVHLELTGGVRTSVTPIMGPGASRVNWGSFDADWGIGPSIYLLFSLYRESGPGLHDGQSYLSISYRF